MNRNKTFITFLMIFFGANLFGVTITNKTGHDIWLQVMSEEDINIKLTDNGSVEGELGDFIYDSSDGNYILIGTNSAIVESKAYLPKEDNIKNLTIIKGKKGFIAYDATKHKSPYIIEDDEKDKSKKNKSNFLDWKKTAFGLAGIVLIASVYFWHKSKINKKQENK